MNAKYLFLGAMASCLAIEGSAAEPESGLARKKDNSPKQPNIILIMADDMGYSDIGCYGSEIPTPNLDALAQTGIRYTQFYNTARSCPSRASLLTGLYAHQAGIGRMSEDPGSGVANDTIPYGYKGCLNRDCVTIAEVLKTAGYDTYMAGKWHVGMHGSEKWPLQRGFDRFYGILAGACNYLRPHGGRGLTLDNTKLDPPEPPYYTTDAFTDYALEFISNREEPEKPFFLYLSFNAPHWPLQAHQEDIDKFMHVYDSGWQEIRQARLYRMKELGIVPQDSGFAEWESRMWNELTDEEKANSSLRMAVYAAQIHCLDRNVGRIVDYIEQSGQRENTIIIFLSDNGGCAEPYSETGSGTVDEINGTESWVRPSYGLPWAQVSNTPYRKYKVRAYEGGISTPMILSWPAKTSEYAGELRSNIGHITDFMATFVDAAGAQYPETFHDGHTIHSLDGRSLLPTIDDPDAEVHDYIFGEHFENRYIRHGKWKAMMDQTDQSWELYDISVDRCETNNLAEAYPEIVEMLAGKWQEWADTHHVFPK